MSNKHVFCQLSRTHLYFVIIIFHQRPEVMEFEIIEVK